MPKIFDSDIKYKLQELDSILKRKYRLEHPLKDKDWRAYEQEYAYRIKKAMISLDPLINEAVSSVRTGKGPGKPGILTLEQKVKLLPDKEAYWRIQSHVQQYVNGIFNALRS